MYAWSLSWDVLWYLMGRNLCFNRRHWLIDMIPRSRNWTSDFAHVQTANSTGSYGSVWEKHLPNSDGFSDGESPIKNNSLQEKCDFGQPKIGLLHYIDEVCVSSLQSHIMATPFDILMLAPDASMALSIGGGAGSWRANSSPKAPGKT